MLFILSCITKYLRWKSFTVHTQSLIIINGYEEFFSFQNYNWYRLAINVLKIAATVVLAHCSYIVLLYLCQESWQSDLAMQLIYCPCNHHRH